MDEKQKNECYKFMQLLEEAHEILNRIPKSENRIIAGLFVENAHTQIQNLIHLLPLLE